MDLPDKENRSQGRIIEKAAISIWHSKPIWSLNLNFDSGEVEKLNNYSYDKDTSLLENENQESKPSENKEILEKGVRSIWNSKPIWSLNLNFDIGDVDRLEKEKSE